ncbi:MAG: DUF3494 domain-containing protein [Bradymonadaceae bacterium]|nr:DUF3494 domain-containing protein [Lujinxingiaceae bacterium]
MKNIIIIFVASLAMLTTACNETSSDKKIDNTRPENNYDFCEDINCHIPDVGVVDVGEDVIVIEDVADDVTEDVSEDVAEDVGQDIVEEVGQDVGQDIVEEVGEDASQDILEDVLPDVSINAPFVLSTDPEHEQENVRSNTLISATFNEEMEPTTFNEFSFFVTDGTDSVTGEISYLNDTVTFTPDMLLVPGATYIVTITTGATNLAGEPMALDEEWEFTIAAEPRGPGMIDLGLAGNFTLLSKTGITATGAAGTSVEGDMGVSPIDHTSITGFGMPNLPDPNLVTSTTSPLVTGDIYAANFGEPTPAYLTTAISDMETAFTNKAHGTPDTTELGAGKLDGLSFSPGLHVWSTNVTVDTFFTLEGGSNDTWIFQIEQELIVGDAATMLLGPGIKAENIFWQVTGQVTLDTNTEFHGILIGKTAIVMKTGAKFQGRALAQTEITLDANEIKEP